MKNALKLLTVVMALSLGFMACEAEDAADADTIVNADTGNGGGPTCTYSSQACWEGAADSNCDWTCMYDPDCKSLDEDNLVALGFDGGSSNGKCDWDTDAAICEPAYKCTETGLADSQIYTNNGKTVIQPCPNDNECGAGMFPCGADGHCDKWCPCDLDSDCVGGVAGTDCCPDITCIDR